jgi:mRNA interferase MazF
MIKGYIVLIPFPFTDLSGIKNRPALILIDGESDITVSFITTQLKWQEDFDVKIEPSSSNGLKRTSLIRLSKLGIPSSFTKPSYPLYVTCTHVVGKAV